MKFFSIKKIVFLIISLSYFFFIVVLNILQLKFINDLFNYLLPIVCFILVAAWAFLIVKYKSNKRWPKIVVIAIPVLILTIISPYIIFFATISGEVYFEASSPSGKNKVIVFEGGFIDAFYEAYPKMGIFYKHQDNGHVSKHDYWGGADIEVEWKADDLAYVNVNIEGFTPNKGSNKDDIIIVSFNQ